MAEVGECERRRSDPVEPVRSIACDEASITHFGRRRRSSLGRALHDRSPRALSGTIFRASPPTRLSDPSQHPGHRPAATRIRRREAGRCLAVGAGDAGNRYPSSAVRRSVGSHLPWMHEAESTMSWGTSNSSGRSTTRATAPRSSAAGAKSCPSARMPGTQKRRAVADRRAVVARSRTFDAAPSDGRPGASPRSRSDPSRRESTNAPTPARDRLLLDSQPRDRVESRG